MRLAALHVDGLRALGERRFELRRDPGNEGPPASIVAVTGPPASGKTTFLEAIVAAKEGVAAYGATAHVDDLIAPRASAAKLQCRWWLSPPERERFDAPSSVASETLLGSKVPPPAPEPLLESLLGEYDASAVRGKVEYFHAHRRFPFGESADLSKRAGDLFDKRLRLSTDNAKYASLLRFIVASGLGVARELGGSAPEPGRVTRAFAALCTTKRLGGLYQEGDAVLPGFLDAQEAAYGLGQLADSEMEALLFATTWVRAGLVDNVPGSVVLIDTPERVLGHAAGAFVRALSELGPNNQLVVATQSAAVLDVAEVTLSLAPGAAA